MLAQGSDSLLDLGGGAILAYSAWIAAHAADDDHPFGHHRAEPIGALVTAVLAGVLAFEVLRSGIGALLLYGGACGATGLWLEQTRDRPA